MNTGEDAQGLRKIIDFSRLISIFILAVHFYLTCYGAFEHWGFTAGITDRIISNLAKVSWFNGLFKPKLAALLFLLVSLIGAKGKKDEKQNFKTAFIYILTGLIFFFISYYVLLIRGKLTAMALAYMGLTSLGYLLFLSGGTMLSRVIRDRLNNDIFNRDNETFPQEERLIENEYSVNLPAQYLLRGKIKKSYIHFINMFRALLVLGSPGS